MREIVSPLDGFASRFGGRRGAPAVLTIETVGTQDGNGDLPITYVIDKTSSVRFWLYPAAEDDPTTVAELSSAPFVSQGSVVLTPENDTINLDIVGTLSGSVKGVAVVAGGNDLVIFGPFTLASPGFSLLMQGAGAPGFATTKDYTVDAVSGDTTVFLVGSLSATHAVTSIVADPGGANETTATIRTQGVSNGVRIVIADAVWPVTGSRTVRVTFANSVGDTLLTALNAGGMTYQNASNATFTAANPSSVTQTINTTAGDSVVFAALLNTQVAVETVQGVDEIVGSKQLASTRGFDVAKNDAVAGGTPESFQLRWPTSSNIPGHAALGVYA
jgi:hypothetical protein